MVRHSRWLLAFVWLAAAVVARAAEKSSTDKASTDKTNTVKTSSDKTDSAPANGARSESAAVPQQNLTSSEQKLATEFKDLEGVLMRMRDLIRPTDPNRAALIERALKESGDRRVESDFQEIVDMLRQEQLGNAARKQGKVNDDLEAILQDRKSVV
jgi:hypothetical protein